MDTGTQFRMRYVWTICLAAALGGLLFGYDWVVIGGAEPFYEAHFQLRTPFEEGWAMSCALVGCLIGALISGGLSDRFGRKRLLILAGVLFLATGIGTALAPSFARFVVFRLLGGMGIGLASNISPMYIAEVSPAKMRGRLVSLNQLAIVIGILIAQFVNYLIGAHGSAVDEGRVAAAVQSSARAESPQAIREFIAKYGWKIKPEVVDEFLAEQGEMPQSAAVVEFMAKHELTVEKTAVEVARHGLVPWNEEHGWRWMFGAGTLPAILFFVAMFAVPESPRWLVKNGKTPQARKILSRIGGPAHADSEIMQIEGTLVNETEQVHFRELLDPRMLKILLLGVVLAVFQQWCGINVIFNYAKKIFEAAGYGVSDILMNIVITGTVNLAFTFVAIFTVDRLGRRSLMLGGAAGLAGIYALIGASYFFGSQGEHVLLLVVLAIACYACTLAPVTWVVLSEIYPNRIRGAAMSVSVFALWAACFVLTLTFPILKEALGAAGTFWIYGGICILGFFFIKFRLPETKGKSLEEIERELT
jgi:MFS family permease